VSAELAETATAAEAVEPLNREDAEKLDRRIRRMAGDTKGKLDTLGALVADAKAGRIHEPLGFKSWTAYLADALSELCSGQGIQTRREVVAYLYGENMSQRGIAEIVGVSQKTVDRDMEQVSHGDSPDAEMRLQTAVHAEDDDDEAPADLDQDGDKPSQTTTGLDGKTYPRERKKQPPAEKPRRPPITETFHKAAYELGKLTRRIERLAADDRFTRNRTELARIASDLIRARDLLTAVIDQLDVGSGAENLVDTAD
jgi:hypothetical protein